MREQIATCYLSLSLSPSLSLSLSLSDNRKINSWTYINVVDFTKIHKLSLFSYKIRDSVWKTSMGDCCMIKRIRGSYLPHPLLVQDKYIVAIW